jgi:hypothetical protein
MSLICVYRDAVRTARDKDVMPTNKYFISSMNGLKAYRLANAIHKKNFKLAKRLYKEMGMDLKRKKLKKEMKKKKIKKRFTKPKSSSR